MIELKDNLGDGIVIYVSTYIPDVVNNPEVSSFTGIGIHGYTFNNKKPAKGVKDQPGIFGYHSPQEPVTPLAYFNREIATTVTDQAELNVEATTLVFEALRDILDQVNTDEWFVNIFAGDLKLYNVMNSDLSKGAPKDWSCKTNQAWRKSHLMRIMNAKTSMDKWMEHVNITALTEDAGSSGAAYAKTVAIKAHIMAADVYDEFEISEGKPFKHLADIAKIKETAHPLLCKEFLYGTTFSETADNVYYIGAHVAGKKEKQDESDKEKNKSKKGNKRKAAEGDDPDFFLGKPSPNHSYGVVILNNADPVLRGIRTRYDSYLNNDGAMISEHMVISLREATRESFYKTHYLETGALAYYEEGNLLSYDGAPLIRRLAAPKMAYCVEGYYRDMHAILSAHIKGKFTGKVFDITDKIFDCPEGKPKRIKPELGTGWKGDTFTFPINGHNLEIKLSTTLDLPDRNSMNRMASKDPVIKLLIWEEEPCTLTNIGSGVVGLRYATVFELDDSVALFSSYHSNLIMV